MSKVYKCDRCGAIEPDDVNENTRFTKIGLRIDDFSVAWKDLCPHCTKKLEDFLSDPNCMETVEEDDMDKEKSELSVECHTNAAGVTVPDSQPFVDKVAAAVSDNPDDPCPCYAKQCIHLKTCLGCKEYDEWKERQK